MHGTGNDFVVVDGRAGERDWAELARAMCERHTGVGADGLLVLTKSERAPLRMRMYNPDGSESEMCGNGIRCFVKHAIEDEIVPARSPLAVETGAGVLEIAYERVAGEVTAIRASMGAPRLAPAEIPVRIDGPGPVLDLPLTIEGHNLSLTCVSMGNPHAVAFIDTPVAGFPLGIVGPKVERHAMFPNRTNFHVARVLARDHIEMRPWERGAGPTLACGSGAAAVCVAARLHGLIGDTVRIDLPGGALELEWLGEGPVTLSGPAAEVFRGSWPG